MSEGHSNSINEMSQTKVDASSTAQRPGSASQSQRRTPQKLGPRKHNQNQSDHQSPRVSSAHDIEHSGQDSASAKPLFGAAAGSQSNGIGHQQQQSSDQSTPREKDQSRRRRSRRRGRGQSTTQTSESDTSSVSEVAQGGRRNRNRNRKKPDQSPQPDTEDTKSSTKMGGASLDTLEEVGESADGSVEATKSKAGGVKTSLEIPGKSTANKKKGKGKKGDEKGEEKGNLRLRIDLDLDLELELKAKIQGAVTLALLD